MSGWFICKRGKWRVDLKRSEDSDPTRKLHKLVSGRGHSFLGSHLDLESEMYNVYDLEMK